MIPTLESDDEKATLVQTFQALSLAADDFASAKRDVEKTQIASTMGELLLRLQHLLARCNSAAISTLFTPSIFENWCRQLSQAPTTSDQYDLICDVLKTCFAALDPQIFFRDFAPIIAAKLTDVQLPSNVKELLLKQVSQFVDRIDSESISESSKNENFRRLWTAVSSQLLDNATSVSEGAVKCLVSLCRKQPIGTRILFSCDSAVEQLRNLIVAKEVVRFRLYEFIGVVCTMDADSLKLCAELGFVDALLKEIDSNDVLCQLNAMEILTEMAGPKSGSDHCLRYFRDHGVLQKLNSMLVHAQQAPDATFLFPAVIRFFGHLSRLYPKECCEGFPLFLTCVLDLVLNYHRLEVGQRLLAFDTLGMIGSTPEGKLVLASRGDILKKCLACFGNSFKQGPIELRVRHIEAFGLLIDLPEPRQTPELLALTERWFSWLESSGTLSDSCKLILDLFRQPFADIHVASGEILKKLVVQPWGCVSMAKQPGFLEYLLNRSTEHTMEGRYIKFEIIQCLTESKAIADAFDPADILRLKEYVREGPLYVKAQAPNVAFQEA